MGHSHAGEVVGRQPEGVGKIPAYLLSVLQTKGVKPCGCCHIQFSALGIHGKSLGLNAFAQRYEHGGLAGIWEYLAQPVGRAACVETVPLAGKQAGDVVAAEVEAGDGHRLDRGEAVPTDVESPTVSRDYERAA